MTQELKKRMLDTGLLPQEAVPVTAALSGGADSTALLCLLHDLQAECGFSLRAVHVHHGIRGAEADRDAAFCKELCRRLKIPLHLIYVNAPLYAQKERVSMETAARILRYRALGSAAPTGLIATAHHAGDQAETMLFHLIRGSGLGGLCGIPMRRERIIRPMLSFTKDEILAYLREIHQDYVTDSTNLLCEGSRNLLRHEVLPILERYNPQCISHMARTAALLTEDEAYLQQEAARAYAESRADSFGGLKDLHRFAKPVRMRVYMHILREQLQIDPSYELLCAIDSLSESNAKKLLLNDGAYAEFSRDALYFYREQPPLAAVLPLKIGNNMLYAGRICRAELLSADAISPKIHKSFTKSMLDYDKIKGTLYFRQRQPSDRITLPARPFASSLKTCIQAAVPRPMRQSLYALYDDCGCVFCEAVGIAARVKPDADTKTFLRLTVSDSRLHTTLEGVT